MRNAILIIVTLCALSAAPGCRTRPAAPAPQAVARDANAERGVLDVDPAQAAREVLETVPLNGRLRSVMDRGALRVGLPPAHEPFQSQHPDLGRPAGFNVALAEQLAKVLNVEASVAFLPGNTAPSAWPDDFDVVFQEPGMNLCAGQQAIPYFLLPTSRQWLTICVAHADPSLEQALRNTLDWFVETGMFTYLYTEYFP